MVTQQQPTNLHIVGNRTKSKVRETTQSATPNDSLPATGFVRIWQIVGCTKRGIPALIPICRTTFLNGIGSGKYKINPVKLGERTTAYRVEEIRALIAELGGVVQ